MSCRVPVFPLLFSSFSMIVEFRVKFPLFNYNLFVNSLQISVSYFEIQNPFYPKKTIFLFITLQSYQLLPSCKNDEQVFNTVPYKIFFRVYSYLPLSSAPLTLSPTSGDSLRFVCFAFAIKHVRQIFYTIHFYIF